MGLLAAAGAAVYANSLRGAAVLDDGRSFSAAAAAAATSLSSAVFGSARPVADWSLALHYRLAGAELWSYHAVNAAVHIMAAALLAGCVRRTLLLPGWRSTWGSRAGPVSTAVALLWLVHPLQTASVTYLAQRCESMMGLLYLAVLYFAVRAADSQRPRFWQSMAIAASACGMGIKEVMITAPAVVLLYDCVFLRRLRAGVRSVPCAEAGATDRPATPLPEGARCSSRAGRWRQTAGRQDAPQGAHPEVCAAEAPCRVGLHPGLWITACIPVALWAWNVRPETTPSAGFGLASFSPWTYACTQAEVLARYAVLTLWPHPQCLDYAWPAVERAGSVLPAGLLLIGAMAVCVRGLMRRSGAAFCGAWILLILAPSSSILPIDDAAFEHRMYLPLAGVLTLLVLSADALQRRCRRAAWEPVHWLEDPHRIERMRFRAVRPPARLLLTGTVVLLAALSARRNALYGDAVSMWSDVTARRPHNVRALCNLGIALDEAGHADLAAATYQRALELEPDHAETLASSAKLLLQRGQLQAAEGRLRDALRGRPRLPAAHNNLGAVLAAMGRIATAADCFKRAVVLEPGNAEARGNLAAALLELGRHREAAEQCRVALRIGRSGPTRRYLGSALLRLGDVAGGLQALRQALIEAPGSAAAHNELGIALVQAGSPREAVTHFRVALELDPFNAGVQHNLNKAVALLSQQPAGRGGSP